MRDCPTGQAIAPEKTDDKGQETSDDDATSPDEATPGTPTIPDEAEVTRRGVPTCSGTYIQGILEGVKMLYAVDTGAARTIVSSTLYRRIPKGRRPELRPTRPLHVADGRPMEVLGSGTFELQLGTLRMKAELTVASISDEVLLGADIIQNGSEGPADLLLSEERMILHGVSIPLMLYGAPERTRKAYAALLSARLLSPS